MRDMYEIAAPGPRRLEGWHVLAMLLGFFGLVFAVNGYFLVKALATHGGVVAVEPYRKGLAYNQRIAASDAQAALGWRDEVKIASDGSVTIAIADRDGRPVSSLVVSAGISRPSTSADERALDAAETVAGTYTARTAALADGTWIVTAEARRASTDAEPVYRLRRRVWLKR